jgi:hypothetical protein
MSQVFIEKNKNDRNDGFDKKRKEKVNQMLICDK